MVHLEALIVRAVAVAGMESLPRLRSILLTTLGPQGATLSTGSPLETLLT